MAVFCILLTACTNSDNTDTNQIIAETIKTESVNSEIPSNQTAHDIESESKRSQSVSSQRISQEAPIRIYSRVQASQ